MDECKPLMHGLKFSAMPPSKRFREMEQLSGGEKTMVRRCRLKPAETRVESALGSEMGEAPYGPLFPHSVQRGRPPMHRTALESAMR